MKSASQITWLNDRHEAITAHIYSTSASLENMSGRVPRSLHCVQGKGLSCAVIRISWQMPSNFFDGIRGYRLGILTKCYPTLCACGEAGSILVFWGPHAADDKSVYRTLNCQKHCQKHGGKIWSFVRFAVNTGPESKMVSGIHRRVLSRHVIDTATFSYCLGQTLIAHSTLYC